MGAGLVALLPLSAAAQTTTQTTTAPTTTAPAGMQAPEGATGRATRTLGTATKHMAAAANPLAAEAGREILRAGGNAVDAAIATQLVLGLVEPQSSGLGGGAFFMFYDGKAKALTTYDGRETARCGWRIPPRRPCRAGTGRVPGAGSATARSGPCRAGRSRRGGSAVAA